MTVSAREVERLFPSDSPGLAVYRRVESIIQSLGPVQVRVTKSQVAFRRHRGFAYVWRPGQYVASEVPAVLSIALPHPIDSPRFKQTVQPSATTWMHHLEVRSEQDLDGEVIEWLGEAYRQA